jgi:hypothetical protein
MNLVSKNHRITSHFSVLCTPMPWPNLRPSLATNAGSFRALQPPLRTRRDLLKVVVYAIAIKDRQNHLAVALQNCQNLAVDDSLGELPRPSSDPSDRRSRAQNRSLTESVSIDLSCTFPFRSDAHVRDPNEAVPSNQKTPSVDPWIAPDLFSI